jgi:large subunit ribosomal protein L30
MYAVVRVRGTAGVKKDIEDTLKKLRLDRVNHCVLVPKTPSFEGMLKKAKYYITWGEINPETLEKLIIKRGRTSGNKRLDKKDALKIAKILGEKPISEIKTLKSVFRLNPPSKGYKPVRRLFPKGALGNRREKINYLLKRMI